MRMSCRHARPLAIAGLALSIMLLATGAASAGFLDSLFAGNRQQPAALPYAEPAATPSNMPSITVTPREPAAQYTTYCVRLCDGRYFPIQRQSGATPIQACNALCPAAKTKIFSGSEISHASAGGARYADLENAFLYRKTIVPGCTCNGRDTFGLAPVDVTTDPTLQAGDIVATKDGLQKFTGSQAQLRKGAGFTPVNPSESQRRRVATTAN
jgi:hypothetical protein